MIKLNDGGTIFFRQKRIGKNGKPFQIYKFRTMRELDNTARNEFEPGNISRVTPIGKILRKAKIDELPQLINVLKGEMSIVGPRPEVVKWTNFYPEKWQIVLSVKPGMTDYSSIAFSDEEEVLSKSDNPEVTYRDKILPRKLILNIEYINKNSISGDLIIIFNTIKRIISTIKKQ